jgi:hypothetical protein
MVHYFCTNILSMAFIRWTSLSGQLILSLFLFFYAMSKPFEDATFDVLKIGAALFVFFKIGQRFQDRNEGFNFLGYFYVISISLLLLPYTDFLKETTRSIGSELLSRIGAAMLLIESVVLFTLEIRKKS